LTHIELHCGMPFGYQKMNRSRLRQLLVEARKAYFRDPVRYLGLKDESWGDNVLVTPSDSDNVFFLKHIT